MCRLTAGRAGAEPVQELGQEDPRAGGAGGGEEEAGPLDRELRPPAALSISKQEGLTETVRSLVSAEKAATQREALSPHGGQLFS